MFTVCYFYLFCNFFFAHASNLEKIGTKNRLFILRGLSAMTESGKETVGDFKWKLPGYFTWVQSLLIGFIDAGLLEEMGLI